MVVHHQTHGSDDGTLSTTKNVYCQNNRNEFSVFERQIEAQRETIQRLQRELSMKEHDIRRYSEWQEDLMYEAVTCRIDLESHDINFSDYYGEKGYHHHH
mmetsp:Transcript_7120/g.17439  ORF Transcript_7120/g.17439 Transcript_7120/m.17439 type:complete len:100 (+) Transcript_7120:211-510(+)